MEPGSLRRRWVTLDHGAPVRPASPYWRQLLFSAIARIFRTPDLRRKIGFTLGIIALFRLGSFIPAPFVDFPNVQTCLQRDAGTQGLLVARQPVLAAARCCSCRSSRSASCRTSRRSIIVQLLRVVIPHFETLYKEGQSGPGQAHAVHPLPHDRARAPAVDDAGHGRPQRRTVRQQRRPRVQAAHHQRRVVRACCSWSSP